MRILFLSAMCILFSFCNAEEEIGKDDFVSNSIVIVDPTLQSGMVLQQNVEFEITGTGTPGEKIRVYCSWENTSEYHIADVGNNSKWNVAVNTPAGSNDAFSIVVEGRSTNTFENILIGEVWLCAGQSNMYYLLKDVVNGEEEVANSFHPKIRLLNMERTTAENPVDEITAKWTLCSPDYAAYFSAVGYFFGRKLNEELDMPIGLIGSNWGNTGAEVWTKRELVLANPVLTEEALRKEGTPHADGSPHIAGSAYNAMIYPLRNIPIAGIIWYQGENNQDKPYIYAGLLQTMVGGWRDDWGQQFPFYIAQICPYRREWNYLTHYSNPAVRFMQAVASSEIPNSGIEVNDDIGNPENIHPANKQDVGLRLAWLALGQHYGFEEFSSKRCPVYESYEISGNKIIVRFKFAEPGLTTTDSQAPTMFEISGDDCIFYPAEASIVGNTVELTSPSVENPVAARMGWSFTKVTNLRSANELPVSVFRTYDWKDETEEP